MDYKQQRIRCMHTLSDGVVLKGVYDGWVDDAMSFVKSWSDGLQTASIHTMHACIINEGGVVAIFCKILE